MSTEDDAIGDEIAVELEAIGTAAVQILEQVTAQSATVQVLCAKVQDQANFMRAWNRLIARGAQASDG